MRTRVKCSACVTPYSIISLIRTSPCRPNCSRVWRLSTPRPSLGPRSKCLLTASTMITAIQAHAWSAISRKTWSIASIPTLVARSRILSILSKLNSSLTKLVKSDASLRITKRPEIKWSLRKKQKKKVNHLRQRQLLSLLSYSSPTTAKCRPLFEQILNFTFAHHIFNYYYSFFYN